jgi:hypothetical protein
MGYYTQRPQSAQEIVGVSSAGDGIDSDDLEFTLRHQFEASNEALQKRKHWRVQRIKLNEDTVPGHIWGQLGTVRLLAFPRQSRRPGQSRGLRYKLNAHGMDQLKQAEWALSACEQ